MALNTGIVVTQSSSAAIPLQNNLPIILFGTVSTGTLAAGVLTRIRSAEDATTILGAGTGADTLPKAVAILQRYGCGNLIVCKITGVDAAAQETDLIARLDLVATAPTLIGEQPRIVLFPTFTSAAVIAKAIATATATNSVAICTFTAGTTVAQAITARGTTTALGTRSPRLIVCHGFLKNAITPTTLESLGLHLTGVLANLSYGASPLGHELLGVNGVDVPYVFSISDEQADPEKLNDVGVVSLNLAPDNTWLLWGSRNSSYTEGSSSYLTFINAVRSRDEISIIARIRALKLLGQPSDFTTAAMLSESYRTMLSDEVSAGNIRSYSNVEIDLTKTDYAAFKIWHNLEFQIWLPLELIGVNVYLSLANI
jgi:phage tail sheath protein FI